MQTEQDPTKNDCLKPDYKISWINPKSMEIEHCTIFTYGNGKDIAIATFRSLYPGHKIVGIEELEQVG